MFPLILSGVQSTIVVVTLLPLLFVYCPARNCVPSTVPSLVGNSFTSTGHSVSTVRVDLHTTYILILHM